MAGDILRRYGCRLVRQLSELHGRYRRLRHGSCYLHCFRIGARCVVSSLRDTCRRFGNVVFGLDRLLRAINVVELAASEGLHG